MLFFFVLSTASALWRRVYSQKSSLQGKAAPALGYIIGTAPLGAIVGFSLNNWRVEWSATTLILLTLMATFIALFNWLIFEASKKLPVALLFQILFQVQTVTAIVLGWLFLSETLNTRQMLGGLLLVAGAVIAARSHIQKRSPHLTKAAVLTAVLASAALGAGITAEKASLQHMSLASYYVIGYFMQALALTVIAQKDLRTVAWRKLHKFEWLGALFLGVLGACTGFFFIYALRTADNVALVTVVSTFQMPLIAIAGYFILKEKEIGWKLVVAAVVSFTGLLIAST